MSHILNIKTVGHWVSESSGRLAAVFKTSAIDRLFGDPAEIKLSEQGLRGYRDDLLNDIEMRQHGFDNQSFEEINASFDTFQQLKIDELQEQLSLVDETLEHVNDCVFEA